MHGKTKGTKTENKNKNKIKSETVSQGTAVYKKYEPPGIFYFLVD